MVKKLSDVSWTLYPVLFIAFSLYVLLGMLPDFCQESGSMTPFYINSVFISEILSQPMGIAKLCSHALMGSFVIPWVGSVLFIVLGTLLAVLVNGALRMHESLKGIGWIVPMFTLIPFVSEGYELYVCKHHGDEFVWLFLLIVLFCIIWLARLILVKFNVFKFKSNIRERTDIDYAKMATIPNMGCLVGCALYLVLFVASGVFVYSQVFKDENFDAILKMKHAMEDGDYDKVLEVSAECENPTRLQVLMNRIALFKTGRSGESTFSYPDGDADYNAKTKDSYLRLIGATPIYYQYGKLNYAYRWAMEDMVEYGERPAYLLYMLKISILNRELQLADKYAKSLSTSPFYKSVAEKYSAYIADTSLINNDPEMQNISNLTSFTNSLEGDKGLIERYLLDGFTYMKGGNEDMQKLTVDCALIEKDIPNFWPAFANIANKCLETGERIPRHYQEAALLFSRLQGRPDLTGLPLDQQICRQFEQLVALSSSASQMGDDYNREVLKEEYGNTYWYYYFFTKDLKSR